MQLPKHAWSVTPSDHGVRNSASVVEANVALCVLKPMELTSISGPLVSSMRRGEPEGKPIVAKY